MPVALSYSVTKEFSARRSWVGISAIALVVILSVVITVFTKGQVLSPEIHYLPNHIAGYTCNSTAIYPGQTFGGVDMRSAFTYTSLSSFAYAGDLLNNCLVQRNTTLDVMGPPIGWPRFAWNHTITCSVNGSNASPSFSVVALNHAHEAPSNPSVGIWNQTVAALQSITTTRNCDGSAVQAFTIDEEDQVVLMPATNTIRICSDTLSNFTNLQTLSNTIKDAIMGDFSAANGTLNPLPNILYPCTANKKVWAPMGTILWDCYTSAAATFSPAFAVIIWLLRPQVDPNHTHESLVDTDPARHSLLEHPKAEV